MKQRKPRIFLAALAVLMAMCLLLASCGAKGGTSSGTGGSGDFSTIAGDYYLDLSELGMKLTVYLRIAEDGNFQFSNTTSFEVNKSSGTIQQGTGEYIMVYENVNGEEKKLSDGVTSSFSVKEDGSLDFSGCERIYYGSATAVTRGEDNPDATLVGVPLPADYQEQSTESEFTAGTYSAEGEGVSYLLSLYDDSSYILVEIREENGVSQYFSETGSYGVSTTQLALTPSEASRLSGEVISATELSVPVSSGEGEERTAVSFTKMDSAGTEAVLTGEATTSDGASVSVRVTLFSEGTYSAQAGDFVEEGVLVLDSESGSFKTYPNHPETGAQGLNQVSTVPAGTFSYENGGMVLKDFRLRTSESLSRTKCDLSEN